MPEQSDHQRITDAGWPYRTNSRAWMVYQNPQTRLWYTLSQAMSILNDETSNPQSRAGKTPPQGRAT